MVELQGTIRGRRGVFIDAADAACQSGAYEQLQYVSEIDGEIVLKYLWFESDLRYSVVLLSRERPAVNS